MLRFVASFFTPNIKPINPTDIKSVEETVIQVTSTETEEVSGFSGPFTTAEEHSNDIFEETVSEEVEHSEEDISLIQSLRQQQKQELIQKILLRRISHQAIMNHYAQDHLPLSKVQEKLEEDNLPLIVLQEKLKQRDDISIYSTTKENINFLLYNNSLLAKLRKSKQTQNILTNDKAPTPKDLREYDIWDDAMIGRLMNLIDTIGTETDMETDVKIDMKTGAIGMETIQEETSEEIAEITPKAKDDLAKETIKDAMKEIEKEVIKEVAGINQRMINVKEEEAVIREEVREEVKEEERELSKEVVKEVVKEDSDKESYTFSEESAEDDYDKETIIAESSGDVENNTLEKTKCESVIIAEEIINFGETINVAESLKLSSNESSVKRTYFNKRTSRSKVDSGYGENSISINNTNVKRESKFFGRRRLMLSSEQFPPSSSSSSSTNNNNRTIPKNSSRPGSLRNRNNLDRKSSIHSKKSYDNDISRRSSASSKFSINTTTTGVITEEPNEDDFDDINFRNKFSTAPKRTSQKSNKSLHFLRNLWKSNQSSVGDGEIMNQQDDDAKSNHRAKLQQSKEEGETIETAEVDPDHGYSNFYLAMPNGKWMVRTRTGSRKITGTQYVDKEYI